MFGGTSQFTFGNTPAANPFGTTAATTTASTGFLFGSTPAATVAPSGLNSTFTFGAPTATAPTATPAASQPLTFGTGLQNTSTIRPFGSTTAFGTTPASTTPATGTTGFGGTSLFGATQPAAQPASIFGSTASTFGAPQPAPTANIFGSTLGATTTATPMGTTVKFEPATGQDTMRTKNNTFQNISTKLQCVCSMKEYLNKSMEELRMEDYQANRKFPTTPSVFGATSFASATPFSPAPFSGTTTFAAAPAQPTTTSIFGGSTTATASPFGAAPATSAAPFSFGTSAAPTTSIFGAPAATSTSPFGAATSTAPATTSIFGATQPAATNIFGSTTTASPFGAKPATTQPGFGFGTTTTTATASPFSFASQPAASTSIFSQPATSAPFGSTAPTSTTSFFGVPTSTTTAANPFGTQQTTTNIFGAPTSTAAPAFGAATSTPAFTGFGATAPAATTTNIFGAPTVSSATTAPVFGGFGAQTAAPAASAPFSFSSTATSSAPSIFGATAPAATNTSIFNTQPFGGFNLTQTQPAAPIAAQSFGFSTPFGSTAAPAVSAFGAQTQVQQANIVQPVSMIQQRFLAASLLDPFASRGKKDFTNIDQIKPPTDLIVLSTSSTTATTVTTSTSSPITLPLQSNARKTSSARPLVDIRFKLKPITSSPTPVLGNEEIKSPGQPPTTPTGRVKSPLTADFSEEEEQVLIGRNKMSKLRLSTDFHDTSFQSESIRSLYPVRRLAELENLANMNNNTHIISTVHTVPSSASSSSTTTIDTASAYVSSTTVNNEHTLHPTNNTRGILPLHHSTPLIVHKQPSPTVSHPIPTPVPSITSPPPRSTTPPPPTAATSNQRIKFSSSNTDTRAYQLPKLSREDYFMEPSASELKTLFNDKGQCLVKKFRVGHEKYGSVTFYGEMNVAGLDLDRIIEIDRHELTVYPDDNNKPPVGEELNIPARITLIGVYPTDRTTREEIRNVERIKAMSYSDYLREVTKKFDGEFVHYGPEDGSWTFGVKHFTRYGLDGSEDDFVVVKPATQQKIVNPNFLDQTIALNDTYALASPKTQPMDMEEKENTTLGQQQQNVRFANQSLIGLRPNIVEQLAQSMFCDDDEDDFDGFQQATDRMITSTKIITSNNQPIPIIPEPIIERSTTMEEDKTQMTFNAPQKLSRERVFSKLPDNVANIRGRYFRTNFSPQLHYASIDPLNEKRLLLQTPVHFSEQNTSEFEDFFEVYFSSCIQQTNPTANLPCFQVRQDPSVVQRFIEFYTKIVEESKQR